MVDVLFRGAGVHDGSDRRVHDVAEEVLADRPNVCGRGRRMDVRDGDRGGDGVEEAIESGGGCLENVDRRDDGPLAKGRPWLTLLQARYKRMVGLGRSNVL